MSFSFTQLYSTFALAVYVSLDLDNDNIVDYLEENDNNIMDYLKNINQTLHQRLGSLEEMNQTLNKQLGSLEEINQTLHQKLGSLEDSNNLSACYKTGDFLNPAHNCSHILHYHPQATSGKIAVILLTGRA